MTKDKAVTGKGDRFVLLKSVRIEVLRLPTFDQLLRVLTERAGHFHIIHFDGHGGYDSQDQDQAMGYLFFETTQCKAAKISVTSVHLRYKKKQKKRATQAIAWVALFNLGVLP